MASSKDDLSLIQDEIQINKFELPNPGMAVPVKGHHARQLNPEELTKLDKDTKLVTEFKQQKLEIEAQKNWDLFYKRNTTKFFKDRHWTTREFKELCGKQNPSSQMVILEVGCGVGNFMFPLLDEDPNLYFYACDFSPRAVQFVKDNQLYDENRCCAFQCDLTKDPLTHHIPANSVDIVSMIFVLSAIHPDKMLQALENIATVLKPGGSVLFRDYGLYDHAMLRFTPGHKLSDRFYVRQDGTRAYYFSEEKLAELFIRANFGVASNDYVLRETINRKEGLCVPRVFVQGKFIKGNSSQQEFKNTGSGVTELEDNKYSNCEIVNNTSALHSCSREDMGCVSDVPSTVYEHQYNCGKTEVSINKTLANLDSTRPEETDQRKEPIPHSAGQCISSAIDPFSVNYHEKTDADIAIEVAEMLIIQSIENGKDAT